MLFRFSQAPFIFLIPRLSPNSLFGPRTLRSLDRTLRPMLASSPISWSSLNDPSLPRPRPSGVPILLVLRTLVLRTLTDGWTGRSSCHSYWGTSPLLIEWQMPASSLITVPQMLYPTGCGDHRERGGRGDSVDDSAGRRSRSVFLLECF